MRKGMLILLLLVLAACLCGCSILPVSSDAQPDLRLLERPVYEDAESAASIPSSATADILRLDLWLDGTQTMGGINPNSESMYPHASNKYREGGFHYRFGTTTGLYENVLRSMLAAAEGSRVRVLRYGNERLPDDYLDINGVADRGSTAEMYRSLRRDMLTYAIDPLPGIFADFSAERMTDSFYSLGTPMLNQISRLDESLLENPEKADEMSTALRRQISALEDEEDDTLLSIGDDFDYALLYALDNLDLTKLSVITCDPASIRRITAVSADGSPVRLIEKLLEERGIFDKGLTAGLYAFTLDYMGQMTSFASADLSEPLVWGKLSFSTQKNRAEAALPMPRVLLTLVIGQPEHVSNYTRKLNELLDSSEALREQRGPEKQELVYSRGGETITQEPFHFAYEYLQVSRPALRAFNRQSEEIQLSVSEGAVDAGTRLATVHAGSASTVAVSIPCEYPGAALCDLSLVIEDALVHTQTLPNTPDAVIPEGAQSIALRDRLYLYEHTIPQDGFILAKAEEKEGAILFSISADASLQPGYYHLSLSADYAAGASLLEMPKWVSSLNAVISNEQISTWESFADLLSKHERKRNNVARAFQHAWGPATDALYYDHPYPDFPPVYKAPGLSELVEQFQSAAAPEQSPCLRYAFDVYVTNP